jgi:hypothetical protein
MGWTVGYVITNILELKETPVSSEMQVSKVIPLRVCGVAPILFLSDYFK